MQRERLSVKLNQLDKRSWELTGFRPWKKNDNKRIRFNQTAPWFSLHRIPQLLYLGEGHPWALDGHHAHRLAQLQVQDEDLSGIQQQHVVPLRRQVGQLETVVQRHRLGTRSTAEILLILLIKPWIRTFILSSICSCFDTCFQARHTAERTENGAVDNRIYCLSHSAKTSPNLHLI